MSPYLQQLSANVEAARWRFYSAGAFNVYGLDAAGRALASMEYAKAQAEYSNASEALNAAIALELNQKAQP